MAKKPKVNIKPEVKVNPMIEKAIVEDTGFKFSQFEIDEMILLRRILVDNIGAPIFAIIRDNLDDSNPNRWNDILRIWAERNMYIPIIPGGNIRDGYVTEAGKLVARNKYDIY